MIGKVTKVRFIQVLLLSRDVLCHTNVTLAGVA